MRKELTASIHGKVQGVGFRAYLQKEADDLDIIGYAENLPEGHLEVIAQGEEENLARFLGHLKRGPHFSEIRSMDIEWHDTLQDTFTEFEIR